MKGFTLIEVLITVAILAAVAVIGSIKLFGYYSRQNLELTIGEITAFIRDAQNRSLTQQDGNADSLGDQWGVHFENASQDSVKLFCCGPNYTSGILVSAYPLRASVQFTYPGEGNSEDIIFKKITGLPLIPVTIKIALVGNSAASSTITINKNGVIQY